MSNTDFKKDNLTNGLEILAKIIATQAIKKIRIKEVLMEDAKDI